MTKHQKPGVSLAGAEHSEHWTPPQLLDVVNYAPFNY